MAVASSSLIMRYHVPIVIKLRSAICHSSSTLILPFFFKVRLATQVLSRFGQQVVLLLTMTCESHLLQASIG